MRVVVTGMGIVSPLGIGLEPFWRNALAGANGVRRIASFDASAQRPRIAGEVPDFDPGRYLPSKQLDQMDRFSQLALTAAAEAVASAGGLSGYQPQRLGVCIGTGMGGYGSFEASAARHFRGLVPAPLTVPRAMANAAGAWIASTYHCTGPNLTFSTACSSSGHAIGSALQLLRAGQVDAVIAGGAEACVLPMTMAGFHALRALSTAHDDHPAGASRPFAKGRDGFVMAEGAGLLVLEMAERATERGATIYAVLAGYGASCDASHIVAPDSAGQAAAMAAAAADAAIAPRAIDYINAHATSTPLGDIVETRAIKTFLGAHAGEVAVSATKSLLGHTIGAAAAIGSIAAIMSLRHSVMHPTVNLEEPDPECDLDYVAGTARKRHIRVALCNAFGFGGNNACLLYTRPEALEDI